MAALGEAILGAGKEFESVYYITMSTGFGGGYVFRNELINGVSTCAGEIYNMIVNEDYHHHKGTNADNLNEQCGGYGLLVIAEEIFGYPWLLKSYLSYGMMKMKLQLNWLKNWRYCC